MRSDGLALGCVALLLGGLCPPAWPQMGARQVSQPAPKAVGRTAKRQARPFVEPVVTETADIDVCYNYSCVAEATVTFSGPQLTELRRTMLAARDSAGERAALAEAIARMYGWAAAQSPVGNDKAGNLADGGVPGQMDCIDHTATTTRFLRLLEQRGWMRFHRTADSIRRSNLIFLQHFSAAIEDLGDGVSVVRTDRKERIWAVDSWYADNGKPPWIVQHDEWERDNGPDL